MIESIARAICKASGICKYQGDKCNTSRCSIAPEGVKAGLEVLRTPTRAMLDGARDWSIKKYGQGVGNDGATGCWQSMVDILINELSEIPELQRLNKTNN